LKQEILEIPREYVGECDGAWARSEWRLIAPILERAAYLAHFLFFYCMSRCGRGTQTGLSINPRRGGDIKQRVTFYAMKPDYFTPHRPIT
jgi:hypothetical protein